MIHRAVMRNGDFGGSALRAANRFPTTRSNHASFFVGHDIPFHRHVDCQVLLGWGAREPGRTFFLQHWAGAGVPEYFQEEARVA